MGSLPTSIKQMDNQIKLVNGQSIKNFATDTDRKNNSDAPEPGHGKWFNTMSPLQDNLMHAVLSGGNPVQIMVAVDRFLNNKRLEQGKKTGKANKMHTLPLLDIEECADVMGKYLPEAIARFSYDYLPVAETCKIIPH